MAILSPPRSVLIALAVVFAAASVFYAAMWIFFGSRGIPVELGFDNKYISADHSQLVQSVACPDSNGVWNGSSTIAGI